MKRYLLVFLIAAILFLPVSGMSGQMLGGKGYLHTNAARLLPPGAIDMSLYTRGFADLFTDLDYVIKNGTAALSTSFGFSRKLELGFTQVLYQDLNATITKSAEVESNVIPGDTYIRFKFADLPFGEKMFWGVMPVLRYRTSKYHDIHLEPYSSVGITLDLTFMGSWYEKPLYQDDGMSAHVNLGYVNHNDAAAITDASQELQYLVSFIRPRTRFDYGVELYGTTFIKRPPVKNLSREDWLYITPLVRYKLFKGLQFTAGLDILLIGSENTSETVIENLSSYPNYSTWRLSGRINFTPSTSFYSAPTFTAPDENISGRAKRSYDPSAGDPAEYFDRKALFKWAIEERTGEVEAIDLDLEKIRSERKKAEEELKRLKRQLEKKKAKSEK